MNRKPHKSARRVREEIRLITLAFEAGYIAHEKGLNMQDALSHALFGTPLTERRVAIGPHVHAFGAIHVVDR